MSRYTHRVQELTLEQDPLSIKILHSLWFRTSLLLPNLRKLRWAYEDYTVISSIRLLLSPSLVHLDVWLDCGDHSSVMGFLERYHTFSPNLRFLFFGHLCRYPHVTTAISRAVCRSPNLEVLGCDPIDEEALIHVAETLNLKRFSSCLLLHRPETMKSLAVRGTSSDPPFKNLRILELRIEDLSSITPYFRSQYQPMQEVAFEFRMLPTRQAFLEFFTALNSPTRRGTLHKIKLQCIGSGRPGISETVNFQVLKPLADFNLRTFHVNINNPVSLSDDELGLLAQAWPGLETFNFNQQSGWDHTTSCQIPTLKGLVILLARCPKLHDLGLCADARTIPSLSKDESSIRNTSITRISFANSLIEAPVERVAHFLLNHLPSLTALPAWTSFCAQSSPTQEDRRMWRDVHLELQKILQQHLGPESCDSELAQRA